MGFLYRLLLGRNRLFISVLRSVYCLVSQKSVYTYTLRGVA